MPAQLSRDDKSLFWEDIVIKPSTAGGTSTATWEPWCLTSQLLEGFASSRPANKPLSQPRCSSPAGKMTLVTCK